MDEDLSEIEENDITYIREEASSYNEFSPHEASAQVTIDLAQEADEEDSETIEENKFAGVVDFTAELDGYSKSCLGEEGILVYEGDAYEEPEYGGDNARFDESEDEKPPLPTPKSTSKVVSNTDASASSTSVSKKSLLKIKEPSTSLPFSNIHQTIQRQPDKPCVRDRMRKWLNRNPSVEPYQESFLGVPYSERNQFLDLEDPCRSLYFGKDRDAIKPVMFDKEDEKKRHLCACKNRIWEPHKSSEHSESKRGIASPVTIKGGPSCLSVLDVAPETCRCGVKRSSCSAETISKRQLANMENSAKEYECGRAEDLKEFGTCTCGKKASSPREIVGNPHVKWHVKDKIHKLVVKMLHVKKCHCPKTGWMSSRMWSRKKQKCICKHFKRRQRRFQAAISKIWQRERGRLADIEMQKVKNEKIEQLYRAIGPKLTEEYRQLAAKAQNKEKLPKTDFVKRVLKEFGNQMQKYKLLSVQDGTAFSDYNRSDYSSFQYVELPSGSVYYGQFSPFGMEGRCIYRMSHGPIFVGSMVDGKMEGPGQLIYPNGGRVEGIWVAGSLFDPKYTFSDGLKFEPTGWKYCRMPDRRFVSEIIKGMNSPDNVQLCANHPARQIPKGCLDAGEGFYDPQKKVIIHPSTGKTIRIVGEQEGQWILKNCRREWFEEVPFSRHMYENWYAGTVFTPPLDEADWFAEEFPHMPLPYKNVDDVVEARKIAAFAAEIKQGHGVVTSFT